MTTAAGLPHADPAHPAPSRSSFWKLTLGSVGVVYGDIGTSPLYALKESLKAASHGGALTRGAIFGAVSLILWALIVVVTLKYVLLILRADNKGEGGTLTLMALVQRAFGRGILPITLLGMASAALFYGDAIITPAISVLSAVEGLKVLTPALEPYVLPISLVILIGLFSVQSWGTAAVAAWFGPITVVWFIALAAGSLEHIAAAPEIVGALNPMHGLTFLATNGKVGFLTLGAVFLAVTGAEALYADMGHFGRRPIQTAWLCLVLPALALNYMGQGAMLLTAPEKLENPFFLLYPAWALVPMIALATAATIIASQAVITGAYSLSQQAIQLGLLPRFEIRRTSETEAGQIYVPRINWLLLVGVVFLVIVFRTSESLASAYGIAVTGTMVITATLAFFVMWRVWGWSPILAGAIIAPLLVIDLTLLAANLLKIADGGWMPLMVGGLLMLVMLTWRKGTRILAEKVLRHEVPTAAFLPSLERKPPYLVKGTAVFLTGNPDYMPSALMHNLKHNKVLHEHNVILSVVFEDTPRVDPGRRASVEPISEHFTRVTLRFGFMEQPNVPKALPACRAQGLKFDVMTTSFFLSRRSLRPSECSEMPRWQDKLFIRLARSAHDVSNYFSIPTDRAVEVGAQIAV